MVARTANTGGHLRPDYSGDQPGAVRVVVGETFEAPECTPLPPSSAHLPDGESEHRHDRQFH